MTKKQTIDGVPRDYMLRLTPGAHSVLLGMVEHCLNVRACMGMDEGYKDFENEKDEHDFVKELRTLLDAESPACAKSRAEPAAQRQVEPVATVSVWHVDRWYASDPSRAGRNVGVKFIGSTDGYKDGQPLYAEQPGPVAMKFPERMPTGNNVEGEHNRLSPGVREGWNLYDDAVKRLNGVKP